MFRTSFLFWALAAGSVFAADPKIVIERVATEKASRTFKFEKIPAPVRGDAAEAGRLTLVSGQSDANSGSLRRLVDGRLPSEEDEPASNFFLNAGGGGAQVALDLGQPVSIRQINSYSWHPGGRAPQLYRIFGFTNDHEKFSAPSTTSDPATNGWKLVARIDTRAGTGEEGGQHAASIGSDDGTLGRFRHLLLRIEQTSTNDRFAQTFFSEIDVIDAEKKETLILASAAVTNSPGKAFSTGAYHFVLETDAAPDLAEWAEKSIMPVVLEWYPKLVKMLPSEGYEAPTNVTIRFRDNMGGTPASAGGNRINCNADWFRRNQKGEAVGSVVHEMVHVVQQYGRARRTNPNATRTPGWLVEGIPDYIRWFLYEPQTKGAEITSRNLERAKFDASYRITGNFLDWVTRKHHPDIARKLNAAAREGNYREELWKDLTGKTLQELGDAWKAEHQARLAPKDP